MAIGGGYQSDNSNSRGNNEDGATSKIWKKAAELGIRGGADENKFLLEIRRLEAKDKHAFTQKVGNEKDAP